VPALGLAGAAILLVLAMYVAPGPWSQQGSYAAFLAATAAAAWLAYRRNKSNSLWLLCAIGGATLVAVSGLAASLLAAGPQSVVRGPGESAVLSEPQIVVRFPLTRLRASYLESAGGLVVQRAGRADATVELGRRRYTAAYVFWTQLHPAAYVEAFDRAGHRLTVTQPANPLFLSPVLLFAQRARIAGHDLPVDSFAVPAVHRGVKAILFRSAPGPGILFAVEDDGGHVIPGAIHLAGSGVMVDAGGIRIRAFEGDVPMLMIASIPYAPAVLLGMLAYLAASALFLRPARR